jgi:hypothetical protein
MKYRPSTGSEGVWFIGRWCGDCKHDEAFWEDPCSENSCPIVAATFCYEVDDPQYPAEWTYDANGNPICTAFERIGTPDKQDPNAAIRDLFDPKKDVP